MASPQKAARRKLADISNLPQKPRLLIQEEKSLCIPTLANEYIDQLRKENMALVKMVAQKNKIIEQSGIELDRLRLDLLKMQEQNKQLALQNTQMLVELNSGKDQLKVLRHELGCKTGLLKAKMLEPEKKAKTRTCKNINTESLKCEDDDTPRNTKRSLESNSVRSPQQLESKVNAENKRPFGRKKSVKCATHSDPGMERESTFLDISVKSEDIELLHSATNSENKGFSRPSLSRPSRVAAKKVDSYKEIPLNVKMRR